MRRTIYIHDAGCTCRSCKPRFARSWRMDLALRALTRALLLFAALVSIPFIILHAIASAKGDR